MSNPDVGPRCPACRMGLVTHEPKDPHCIEYTNLVSGKSGSNG